jgi:hypothetical protein
MLVAMVTTPGRPACATISASRCVLLGVEHLVRDALAFVEHAARAVSLFSTRGGAHQHRLAALVAARAMSRDHGVVLLLAASCRPGRCRPCAPSGGGSG